MNVKLKLLFIGILLFTSQTTFGQKKVKDTTSIKEIEEVVVLGFGQKKVIKELTGSISTMTSKSIEYIPLASVDKMLQGRLVGVQTGSPSGQPGGVTAVLVRGISSISGSIAPIFIIDGMRVENGVRPIIGVAVNPLSSLNPDDIESVTVLKDAVSTAVYGADAGAGVIVITTKSGKKGKAKFNLSFTNGVNTQAVSAYRSFTGQEYKEYLRDAYNNANGKNFSIEDIANDAIDPMFTGVFKSPHNTAWGDVIKNNGYQSTVDFSVSGGDDKFTYYTSANKFDQNSIIGNSFFKRLAYVAKLTYQATNKLKISSDFQISYFKTRALPEARDGSNPLYAKYFNRPTDPSRNPDGSWYFDPNTSVLSNQNYNPGYLLEKDYRQSENLRAFAILNVEYKILDHLVYRFLFSPEYVKNEENTYKNPFHGEAYATNGQKDEGQRRSFNLNIQNILDYSLQFGLHNVGVLLIQEAYKSDNKYVLSFAAGVGAPALETIDNFIIPLSPPTGTRKTFSRYGYAVNGHYDYDRLILLDFSYRRDVLSQFMPGKKAGNFWSVGVGVDLAKINFLKEISQISLFKFRSSYGKLGNQVAANPYGTYTYIGNYNNNTAASYVRDRSPNLTWETVNPFNVGVDLELFKSRFKISAEYYHKKTENLIYSKPLSLSQGLENTLLNFGSLVNRGFEFSMNADVFRGGRDQFHWSIGGNLSTLDNQITELHGSSEALEGKSILRVGESVEAFYLRKWAGVDVANGDPLWYVNGRDGATTNDYNIAKENIQGNNFRNLFGGFNNSISYRGFSLDLQFTYGAGGKIYDDLAILGYSDGQVTLVNPGYGDVMGNYWTSTNTNASNPKPMYGGNKNSNEASTRFLYSTDFIRLSNARLAYSFKGDMLKGSGLSDVQVYVLANNAWTHRFDNRFKFDPEINGSSFSNLTLPALKSFLFGVNLSF